MIDDIEKLIFFSRIYLEMGREMIGIQDLRKNF
jgi:hypothetical protein